MIPATSRIYGNAGGSLANAGAWIKDENGRSKIGAAGESKTAKLLNRLVGKSEGVIVLHDLVIDLPPQGKRKAYKFNLDHVVISGDTIHVIDTKVWLPGIYWTLHPGETGSKGGKKQTTRRGLSKFDSADGRAVPMGVAALKAYLLARGFKGRFKMGTSYFVVWPSNKTGGLFLQLYRPHEAQALSGSAFTRRGHGLLSHDGLARPDLADALAPLLH